MSNIVSHYCDCEISKSSQQPVVPTILFLMIRYTRMYFTTMKRFVSSQLYILIAVCTVVCYFSLKSEVSVLLALYFCSIIIQNNNCFLTGFLIVLPQTNFIGCINVLNINVFNASNYCWTIQKWRSVTTYISSQSLIYILCRFVPLYSLKLSWFLAF